MALTVATPQEYLETLPPERQEALGKLRNTLLENLPDGFAEIISGGMIGYVVPHTLYPAGYHCDPSQPLPFMYIASQKNFIALYHMGIYGSPELLAWFTQAYPQHVKTKPDIGKSCIRFKHPNQIPYALIGELAGKITPQQWIILYETVMKKTPKTT